MPDQSEWYWTAEELKRWQDACKFTTRTAPLALGCGRSSYMNWTSGREKVPKYIAMAAAPMRKDPQSWLPDQTDLEEYLEESEA